MADQVSALAFQELVSRGGQLVDRIDEAVDGYYGWVSGAADGGPNGDGYYPMSVPGGPVVLVPSPAKLAAIAQAGGAESTPLTAEAIMALEPALDSNGSEHYPAVSPDGKLRRYRPEMFAARRTRDLDVLPGSEFAEWINCLSSTGMERKLAVSALTRIIGEVIDPTTPPYNVVYDFKKAKPSRTTAGSNIVTTGDNVFSAVDIGKLVNVGGGGANGALIGYIGAVVDARTIKVFTDRSFTTPLNASQTTTNEMVWGTDNTTGLQRAFDDAEPVSIYYTGRVVLIGGMALARQLRFGSIAIVGLGGTACGFVALSTPGSQQPFFADKNTGRYGSLRPDGYTLKGLTFNGQRYTATYSEYRRTVEVRGGEFHNFYRGAPYARIEEIELIEGLTDGGQFNGAFAGQFNSIRAFQNSHCGLRMGFWDLNGTNWHTEANGSAGVMSYMPGANVSTVRSSYNGVGGGGLWLSNQFWPHELGANWCECGVGNTITNLRMQESWSHNLVFAPRDPLLYTQGGGRKNAIYLGTFDDTGDIAAVGKASKTRLPGVRSMIYMKGESVRDNVVELVTGAPQVLTTNYATNGYYDDGAPSKNIVRLTTPGITNDVADWYAGGPQDQPATARGPWGTDGSSSIASRGNSVVVNGQAAA